MCVVVLFVCVAFALDGSRSRLCRHQVFKACMIAIQNTLFASFCSQSAGPLGSDSKTKVRSKAVVVVMQVCEVSEVSDERGEWQ